MTKRVMGEEEEEEEKEEDEEEEVGHKVVLMRGRRW